MADARSPPFVGSAPSSRGGSLSADPPGGLGTLPEAGSSLPPDQTWIDGIYDDADYDDIAVRVASETVAVEPIRPIVAPIALLLFVLSVSDAGCFPVPPRLPSVWL
jgi:hypothetical protein